MPADQTLQPPHTAPAQFVTHAYEHRITLPFRREDVWAWLNDPRTFTDNQVWPWRVEFVAPEPGGPSGFAPGVLTTHHGPLLHLPGILGEIRAPEYRDLQYLYGSYVGSLRLLRPTRLQFWLAETEGGTIVRLRLDSYVRPALASLWRWGQQLFWDRFGRWMTGALRHRQARHLAARGL